MCNHKYNDQTLDAYNNNVEHYLTKTPERHLKNHEPLLKWIDYSITQLPKNSTVFEIGSGAGREADYIEAKGLKVQRSDGAVAFVEYLKAQGKQAIRLNILRDGIKGKFDMIFANAVITHFTPEDLLFVLRKVHNSLEDNGIFAFSTKQGSGNAWVTEKFSERRFVHYWQPDDLRNLVEKMGFKIIFFESGIKGDIPNHTWINISIQKTPHTPIFSYVLSSFIS